MSSLLWPIFVLIFFVSAGVAALWGYRAYTTGDTSLSLAWLLPPRPEPRLAVLEQASVDSKRKLVLIRRDDVEHLIMTGGPVDVVIETGIASPPREIAEFAAGRASRRARRTCSSGIHARPPHLRTSRQ